MIAIYNKVCKSKDEQTKVAQEYRDLLYSVRANYKLTYKYIFVDKFFKNELIEDNDNKDKKRYELLKEHKCFIAIGRKSFSKKKERELHDYFDNILSNQIQYLNSLLQD